MAYGEFGFWQVGAVADLTDLSSYLAVSQPNAGADNGLSGAAPRTAPGGATPRIPLRASSSVPRRGGHAGSIDTGPCRVKAPLCETFPPQVGEGPRSPVRGIQTRAAFTISTHRHLAAIPIGRRGMGPRRKTDAPGRYSGWSADGYSGDVPPYPETADFRGFPNLSTPLVGVTSAV